MVSNANILLCNTSNFYALHFDEKFRVFFNQTSFLCRSLLADASTMVFILSTRFGRGNFSAMVFLRETRLKYQAATNTNSAKKKKTDYFRQHNHNIETTVLDLIHFTTVCTETRASGSFPLKTTNIKLLNIFLQLDIVLSKKKVVGLKIEFTLRLNS